MKQRFPLRGLILATQFLTRIPTPAVEDFKPADLTRSAAFFPLVGLIIGATLAGSAAIGAQHSANMGALAALITWAWITGGLHLDGLGDMADALGAAHGNPARFHEVLKDPHAGSFAVISIALQLIAKYVLLAAVVGTFSVWGLLLVPAWARWGTLVWSRTIPPLKSGLAERFAWEIQWSVIGAWGAVLSALSFWLAPALLTSLGLVALITLFWRWRLGGITGDGLGASVEVMESLLLLALVVALPRA